MTTPRHNPVDVLSKDSLATINLNVLRRIDPEVTQLLATAGHVALYDYDQAAVKWTTKGIEGTLFLIKRRAQPHYQFVVLNKKSQDHFVEDVHGSFKFEATEREGRSYLLYKSKRGGVVGIWFYDKLECQKVLTLLKDVTVEVGKTAAAQPSAASVASPSHPLLAAMQGRTETAGEDGFWDKGSTSAAPAAALLQPDGQRRSHTAADPVAASPASNGGGGALEKLFGSMRAASNSTNPVSAQVTGLPPFRNSESAQSPLSTPTAPSSGGGGTPMPPATQLPTLLKPSFFQTPTGPASARHPDTPPGFWMDNTPDYGYWTPESFDRTPVSLPQMTPASTTSAATNLPTTAPVLSGQDNLLKLFASKAQPEKPAAGKQPEQLSTSATHALVRSAMKVLADSDEFIAVVVQELDKSGLLKHLSASQPSSS